MTEISSRKDEVRKLSHRTPNCGAQKVGEGRRGMTGGLWGILELRRGLLCSEDRDALEKSE